MAIMLGIYPKPRCTHQVFCGCAQPSVGASDVVQAQIGGQGLFSCTVPREHRLEDSVIKWIEEKGETWWF